MSYISLSSAIKSSRVDPSRAVNVQSARFQSTCALSCPVKEKRDIYGRDVCIGTVNSKTQGCDTAVDRITIENQLRPNVYDYMAQIPWGGENFSAISCKEETCAALGAGIDIRKNIRVSHSHE